jgi:hypothetical protein
LVSRRKNVFTDVDLPDRQTTSSVTGQANGPEQSSVMSHTFIEGGFARLMEVFMKYLCLIYSNEHTLHSHPDSPRDDECLAYAQSVQASGRMLAAEPLESVETATTVRMRNGKVSITDGPFAETKEQLAGFYLIEARDLNEALQLAAHIPAARVGSVEVRPVRTLNLHHDEQPTPAFAAGGQS